MTQVAEPFSINLARWEPPGAPRMYDPREIIDWAAGRFQGWKMAMTTAFGMEGVVLLHLLHDRVPGLQVLSVDTGFLFEETKRLQDQLRTAFPSVTFRTVEPSMDPDEQASVFGERLWERDPDLCCRIRKVEPLHRVMDGIDVWFSGVRRGQGLTRSMTQIINWDWSFQAIKICPLATWSRPQVYRYIRRFGLPYNALHDRGYPSVGCTHCTRAVEGARPWDYSREGRWSGTQKTECGINI